MPFVEAKLPVGDPEHVTPDVAPEKYAPPSRIIPEDVIRSISVPPAMRLIFPEACAPIPVFAEARFGAKVGTVDDAVDAPKNSGPLVAWPINAPAAVMP
jgi:hypothetical protein